MTANQTTTSAIEIRNMAERIRTMQLIRSPERTESTTETDSSSKSRTPIGIFWDIENCRIKRGHSFLQVAKAIRDKFLARYWEAEFVVVCDVLKESPRSVAEINAAQVSLVHCPATSKNAADEKLKQLIRKFADVHKSNGCIVLISSDVNFAGDLFGLRYRNLINVILIHAKEASIALITCANEHYDFDSFFGETRPDGIAPRTLNDRSHVDLRVHNLPAYKADVFIRSRLSRLSENCGGKVIEVSRRKTLCDAVVRFPNSASALRAQQRMDGEDIYGKRIVLQNISGACNRSGFAAMASPASLLPSGSNSLVARRTAPVSRYAAYPPQKRPLTNTSAEISSSSSPRTSAFQSYQPTCPNQVWSPETTAIPATSTSNPVDLLVTNLDPRQHPQTMKITLTDLFKKYAMVLNVSVKIQSEGTMVAHIKVSNMLEAQFAISKLQRLKIGSKRISIQFAPDRVDLFLVRSQVVLLLQEVPGSQLPLFKFLELFKARFRTAISLSILYKLRDVCTISDDSYGNIRSRSITLVLKGPVVRNRSEQLSETWFCAKHYTGAANAKGWAELDSVKMPNVFVPLKEFSAAVYKLLDSHNGCLPLYSFQFCYAAVVGDLRTDEEDGVPLEHYVTCVPHVELCTSMNRVKYLRWSEKVADAGENCDTQTEDGESAVPLLSSTPLAVKISLLSRELIDLLKTIRKCRLPLAKFIPAYHHHFGRQCRVADYGYTKLDDLMEALASVVQVMGEGEGRLLTLNHATQTKRFTYDLLRVLKFQKSKQVTGSEFAAMFEQIVNRTFDPVEYGMCSLDDLLASVAKNTVMVTRTDDRSDYVIGVPRREQTAEEVMRTKHFALETVELLRHMPQCGLLFRKFVTAYHHHFGRQCRVSDYGFAKLNELFEAVPDVVRIDDSYELDKKVCLTLPYQIRVVGEQLVSVIRRSCGEKIALDEVADVYRAEYGYALQPEIFDCHHIDELILRLADFVRLAYEPQTVSVLVNAGTRIEQRILRVWSVLVNVPHSLPTFVFLKEYQRKHNMPFELSHLHELNSVISITHADQSKITISLTPFYVLLAKLYWLVYDHNGCLPLVDFAGKYAEKYREVLVPGQFGSDSLVDLVRKMVDVLVIGDGDGDGDDHRLVYLSPALKAVNVDLPAETSADVVATAPATEVEYWKAAMWSPTTPARPLLATWNTTPSPVRLSSSSSTSSSSACSQNNESLSVTPFKTPPPKDRCLVNIADMLPKLNTPKIDRDFVKSLYSSPSQSSSCSDRYDPLLNQVFQNAPDPSRLPAPSFC